MSLLDSIRSLFGTSSAPAGTHRGMLKGKVNIESRFERLRVLREGLLRVFALLLGHILLQRRPRVWNKK